ncbi:MAG TPA: rhomboid family intramembrane serine protease [Terracidiphilus sp.]|nr:rhomboid family intramembrane serine protease [Terracidiphilus sp.]
MGSFSPPPANPEYLRSEARFNPPPPTPVRRRRPSWSYAPATYVLVGINCLVYLVMVAHHVSAVSPTSDQLMHWGADNAGSVLIQGQWWRIVTAMFVHVGFLHLALNMWCLWNLGLLAEPLMGSEGVLEVYILTGAAGNLLSTCVNWIWPLHDSAGAVYFPAGAGASGAVFGIAGALIILLKSHRLPVPPLELKKLRKSVIYFAAINLVIGFSISFGTRVIGSGVSIDNMAHLGGFMCGMLYAAPMVPRIGAPRDLFLFRRRAATVIVVGILVLFGFYLAQLPR